MRLLAILFNIASLATIAYLIISQGIPGSDEILMVIAFAGAATFSLLYIFVVQKNSGNSSFIGLWLQRKKLEEQQKIDRIKMNK
ncbi:hypothetical protein [Pseudomonas silesiensis]|uniref:hypothetical protein n=1 Tax=Pseudomonas silesiensis TaxID=1853130 RepID=UPI0034D5A738